MQQKSVESCVTERYLLSGKMLAAIKHIAAESLFLAR